MAQLRWTLNGTITEGFVHIRARIVRIEETAFVLSILQSSHYSPGKELVISRDKVLGETWTLGTELVFTTSPDELERLTDF
jgi:hypothetical protein